ncbi:DUF2796 domain-containing protein [Allohahella marinimesophila]|uniref:DUF2796 domain-containing protein n=1 Tax=Allohahella marinimesophila TaxID=1054972 RepID=A0ABP7NSP7_9GAMM
MFKQKQMRLAVAVAMASGSLFLATPATAESKHHDDEHREHGAHEHGAANMTIALEEQQLIVELDSPAMNILGFEHSANTPEQKAVAADMWKRLQHPDGVISLEGGDCLISSADVRMPQFDDADQEKQHGLLDSDHKAAEKKDKSHHDDHDEKHDDHHEGEHKDTHSDIEATYTLKCAKPEQLKSLTVQVFETFPNFEEVQVQWVIDGRQGSQTLKAGSTEISLR